VRFGDLPLHLANFLLDLQVATAAVWQQTRDPVEQIWRDCLPSLTMTVIATPTQRGIPDA